MQFDEAIDALTSLIRKLPLFEPVMKPMLSVVWSHAKEETTIDKECDEQEKKVDIDHEKKMSKMEEEEIEEVEGTCKEIIEEMEKMGVFKEDKGVGGEVKDEEAGKKLEEVEKEVEMLAKDPILALFDESWAGKRRGGL